MGTVFVFLSVLVLATVGLSKLVAILGVDAPPPPSGGSKAEIEGAIAAAVAVHHARHR